MNRFLLGLCFVISAGIVAPGCDQNQLMPDQKVLLALNAMPEWVENIIFVDVAGMRETGAWDIPLKGTFEQVDALLNLYYGIRPRDVDRIVLGLPNPDPLTTTTQTAIPAPNTPESFISDAKFVLAVEARYGVSTVSEKIRGTPFFAGTREVAGRTAFLAKNVPRVAMILEAPYVVAIPLDDVGDVLRKMNQSQVAEPSLILDEPRFSTFAEKLLPSTYFFARINLEDSIFAAIQTAMNSENSKNIDDYLTGQQAGVDTKEILSLIHDIQSLFVRIAKEPTEDFHRLLISIQMKQGADMEKSKTILLSLMKLLPTEPSATQSADQTSPITQLDNALEMEANLSPDYAKPFIDMFVGKRALE